MDERSISSFVAPKPAARKAARKNPASVLLTMAAVGGMVASVALPAYAVNPVEVVNNAPLASSIGAQSVQVSADALPAAAVRDTFTATTPEELAATKAAAALAASYVYRDPGPTQAGDDYPWRGMEGLSPLRYYYGECVDFVAWRLNRDAGYTGPFKWDWGNLTPGGGSASSWTSAWYAHGWPVSSTPVAGAVAVTGYNHVAYVKQVLGDGSVLLEEYNYGNYHSYGQRVISAGSATYLYPPG
ncbi:MAG: CHAP domain-containing protein [Salinibacterium sp.]|nr:CHAP domain-containing protein [Salinibacterium sp.]